MRGGSFWKCSAPRASYVVFVVNAVVGTLRRNRPRQQSGRVDGDIGELDGVGGPELVDLRHLEVDAPGDQLARLVRTLDRLRQLHQHVGTVGGERAHRIPPAGFAVEDRVGGGLSVGLARNGHLLRGPVNALLLQRRRPEVRCRTRRGRLVDEPQHGVHNALLTLLRACRREPVDELVPTGGRSKLTRPDLRECVGIREDHGTEPEPDRQGRVDLPRPYDVVGHPLGLDDDAACRVACDSQWLAGLRRIRAGIKLVEIDRRRSRITGAFERRPIGRGIACR